MNRRRMMMESKKDENVIYVYNGYVENNSSTTYDQIPEYNSSYPNSVATSSIPINSGDRSVVERSGVTQQRVRCYGVDGEYIDVLYYAFNNTYNFNGYIRFLAPTGITSFDHVKIIKTDGTEINYKVIDMR